MMTEQELARVISRIGIRGALLSGAFEDTVGQDIGNSVNAAKTEINTAMQAALKNVSSSEKTNVLTKNLFSRQDKETLSAVHTTNCIMELESHFTGFRVGIHNIHTSAVSGVRVCVSVRDKIDFPTSDAAWAAEYTTSGSDWYDVTFDGSASGTLAPRIAEERPSTTWTDIIPLKSLPRVDGGSRPVVMVRIQLPSGAIMSRPYNQTYNWRTSGPRYYKTSKASVAGVDNKASFTQLANTEAGTINPAIMYYSVKAGRQLMIVADSTGEGIGGTPTCYGAAQMAAYETSTPDSPVEYYNAALHAQVPLTYTPRIQDLINVVNPTHMVYSPWSGNSVAVGGITPEALNDSRKAFTMAMGYITSYKAPIKVVLLEGLPTTTAGRNTGAGDVRRVDYNSWLSTFTGFVPAVGYAASVSNSVDANGQVQMDSTLTGDNVHPNAAGYTKLKQVIKPLLFG